MYDGRGKLLRELNVCVNSLACVKVKEGDNECFRIDSGVRSLYLVLLAF